MARMRSVNEVIMIGWAANDPVLKENKNGQKLAVFNLATRRVWKTKSGERKEEVQYHKIAAWGRLAERVGNLLRKGAKVYIRGYLHNRKIEIEGEEKPRIITEIIVNDLLVLDRRRRKVPQETEPVEEVQSSAEETEENNA
jgi:single-strand DNA-binding protein